MRAIALCIVVLVGIASWARPARAEDEPFRRPPMADAAATMETILEVLEPLGVRILKLDVKPTRASVRLDVEKASVLEDARRVLEASEGLRADARDPARLVEVGAIRRVGDRFVTDLQFAFRHGRGAPAPANPAADISMEHMVAAATVAKLRQVYASRQRITPHYGARYELLVQSFEYQAITGKPSDLTLAGLERLLNAVAEGDTLRVVQVQWTRAEDTGSASGASDVIKKPRIEVAAWRPLKPFVTGREGAVAQAILRGPDSDLVRAADTLAALDEAARMRLLQEIRGQARVQGILYRSEVEEFVLDDAALDASMKQLLKPFGVAWHVSEKLLAAEFGKIRNTLSLRDTRVLSILRLLTQPHDVRFLIRGDGVWLVTREEGDAEGGVGPRDQLLLDLERKTMTLEVKETTFLNVMEYVLAMTGMNVQVDPRVEGEIAKVVVKDIHVEDVPIRTVLDLMIAAAGDGIVWTVRGNVILFTKRHLLTR